MASFYIQKYPKGWLLKEQSYVDKKSKQVTIPKEAYTALGLDKTWPIERARARVKELNDQNALKREDARVASAIAKKMVKADKITSIFLAPHIVDEFEKFLFATNQGTQEHFAKRLIMWKTAQEIIKKVAIEPRMYSAYMKVFYNRLIEKKYSYDYSKKLISLINQWGYHVSLRNNTAFQPIPFPRAEEKKLIEKAYKKKPTNRSGGSTRLTPSLLEGKRAKLTPATYEWLFISLWLGLRPDEIELAQFDVYRNETHNVDVLRIYQPKVDFYKHIPLLHEEQKKAVELLKPRKRPLNRIIHEIFGDRKMTCYAGRKGFENLMASLGETEADISKWLGHTTIKTTDKHYKDKDKLFLTRNKA